MNYKLIIALVVVVGLVTGIWFWQLGRSSVPIEDKGPAPALPAQSVNEVSPDAPLLGRGTLTTLLDTGRSLECAVVTDIPLGTGVAQTEGSVFVSDGLVRADVLTPSEVATSAASSMIIRDGMLYVWATNEGVTTGVKASLTTLREGEGEGLSAREPISLDQSMQYDCQAWTMVDRSIFAPPSDILFRDLTTIIEDGMEYGTTFEAGSVPPRDACAACAQMTDEVSGAACLEQFSCTPEAR